MKDKIVNWAILGTSNISETMANAINEAKNCHLVAVSSRNITRAKTFADKFSIANYYQNEIALLNNDHIDAIYIGLPNHLHKQFTLQFAAAGKHVLCEKPLASHPQDVLEIMQCATKHNVICMEALMYFCHPFTQKIYDTIQSKILGDIKYYNATYTADIAAIANVTEGGSMRNLGCYPLSLIRLLANQEPINIQCMQRKNAFTKNDNQANLLLQFADESSASITVADDIKMTWTLKIYGTNGYMNLISNPWLPEKTNRFAIKLWDKQEEIISHQTEKSLYAYQIEAMNDAILSADQHNVIPLEHSLGNAKIIAEFLGFEESYH